MRKAHWLTDFWYRPSALSRLLAPLAWPYQGIVHVRRWLYAFGLKKRYQFNIPVVVVGNITVGGTGKTPLICALAQRLQKEGLNIGIVSRGYGARIEKNEVREVTPESDPLHVGEEPLWLAQVLKCPVWVGPKRVRVIHQCLQKHPTVEVVLCDDGLQHLALNPHIEIALVDGQRGFGNGLCLPIGPLREPKSRLNHVDFVIKNGGSSDTSAMTTSLKGVAINLVTQKEVQLTDFKGMSVHGVAGIGAPNKFFKMLDPFQIHTIKHPFADHHFYRPQELAFKDNHPILMTEKDALKCQTWANPRMFKVPMCVRLDESFVQQFLGKLIWIKNCLKS